jgi:hypothetical protein
VDTKDRRVVRLRHTKKGERLMQQGRGRRVSVLAGWLTAASADELVALSRSADVIERLIREADMS